MSADAHERRSVRARAIVETALEHPLVGLERRRTALAAAYLLGLVTMFVVSYLGTRVPIDDTLRQSLTTGLDAISMVYIAIVAATILLVPLCYAAWNGGPVLSFVFPLVPVVIGDLGAGAYVLDLDLAIALTVGTSAAALAVAATDARRAGSLRFWRTDIDENRLLFVTGVTIVGAVGVGRFLTAAPSYMLEWYAPMGSYWLATTGIVGSYWVRWGRSAGVAETTFR